MISKNALELCSMILISLGFGNETLMSLIQKWRFFIEECQGGYGWDYSEYRNEIRSRFLIQQLLEDPKIANADELKGCFEELAYLDEIFRSLLQPGVSVSEGENWWERGVLIRAGEEYCSYMKSAHGVVVESVDG